MKAHGLIPTAEALDTAVRAGSAFVMPRGLWHRHAIHERVKELSVTPGGSEISMADDPRSETVAS